MKYQSTLTPLVTQAAFIEECLVDDLDWAEVVDQLNMQMHG
jgi:hypothetical protein